MEQKIKTYFKDKKEIASVYLFGSVASGKDTPSSDVDIAVLFEYKYLESAETFKEQYMMQLGRILRKDIEILVMNRAGEVILNQIFKKGKPIFIQNTSYSMAFKIKSLALYSDFKFYLNRMQDGFVKNMVGN